MKYRGLTSWGIAVVVLALAPAASARLSLNNELRKPNRAPIGWVLVVHGGGWQTVGKDVVVQTRGAADFFRAQGWGTYNIDYRKGTLALTDVLSAYDTLRKTVGPSAPICAWGDSAGGQLVLMLAGERPDLACAISEGGPTDLSRFTSEPACACAAGVSPELGPDWIAKTFITPSFGTSAADLWRWSPVRLAGHIRAKLLLGASSYDVLVPQAQLSDMKRADPAAKTMLLPGAATKPANFTHASVTPVALANWRAAEIAALAAAHAHTEPWQSPHPNPHQDHHK